MESVLHMSPHLLPFIRVFIERWECCYMRANLNSVVKTLEKL